MTEQKVRNPLWKKAGGCLAQGGAACEGFLSPPAPGRSPLHRRSTRTLFFLTGGVVRCSPMPAVLGNHSGFVDLSQTPPAVKWRIGALLSATTRGHSLVGESFGLSRQGARVRSPLFSKQPYCAAPLLFKCCCFPCAMHPCFGAWELNVMLFSMQRNKGLA